MKKYFLLQILLLLSIIVNSQNINCNQSVWIDRFAKLLPKDVCIPQGDYHITQVYKMADVNSDGLDDFIIDWNKKSLQDGDTLFVSIYLQNIDSTFSYFRTFDNLYPIYFERYDIDYIPQDATLIPLLKEYEDFYPFRKLEFKRGSIAITIRFDAESDLKTVYVFDKLLNNWRYKESHEIWYTGGKSFRDLEDTLGPTIDNFTYFWWDK